MKTILEDTLVAGLAVGETGAMQKKERRPGKSFRNLLLKSSAGLRKENDRDRLGEENEWLKATTYLNKEPGSCGFHEVQGIMETG